MFLKEGLSDPFRLIGEIGPLQRDIDITICLAGEMHLTDPILEGGCLLQDIAILLDLRRPQQPGESENILIFLVFTYAFKPLQDVYGENKCWYMLQKV